MNINSTIPIIVYYLNYLIILINVYNIIRISYHLRDDDENRAYFLILLLSVTSLISVNIFSAFNHYLVYFTHKEILMPSDATWTRFTDRYFMFFKSIFNCLMTSQYCIQWMKKFYK